LWQERAEAERLDTEISAASAQLAASAAELLSRQDSLSAAASACEGALGEETLQALESWAQEL
jgi:hypothetical protein